MDTVQAILTRRSVRKWKAKDIPDSLVNTILEAGRSAPSPLNSQPWHFIVLRNKHTIEEITKTAQHGLFAAQAPVVIVVTVDNHAKVDAWLAEHSQHTYSGVGALISMWFVAWSLGLGGCWITLDNTIVKTKLLVPETHEIIGSLAFGYPDEPVVGHLPEDRRPLSEIVSHEKFTT